MERVIWYSGASLPHDFGSRYATGRAIRLVLRTHSHTVVTHSAALMQGWSKIIHTR